MPQGYSSLLSFGKISNASPNLSFMDDPGIVCCPATVDQLVIVLGTKCLGDKMSTKNIRGPKEIGDHFSYSPDLSFMDGPGIVSCPATANQLVMHTQ